MGVKRIVANIATANVIDAGKFYGDLLGLHELMNIGWFVSYGADTKMTVQINFASEGGSGTVVPDLSIEVDDATAIYTDMKQAGFTIEYELTDEPWGVRRFYVRDPFGKLVNIMSHI
ncbi:glyoxalase [Niastella yeongjuensis]|uniref:Glyoxalase n=1 Tax=Niastella yeongjuensis TaxID=354355 RepID=A0A1V9EGK5_9BACT|nr:VOC family protein [Niastella yeongjuensis]OQP45268.1 glyoxalase [Niastella yeongjuensis]SEO27770.1 Glyoxalase-like domain-containing protein [Niastella yeongjuensis]